MTLPTPAAAAGPQPRWVARLRAQPRLRYLPSLLLAGFGAYTLIYFRFFFEGTYGSFAAGYAPHAGPLLLGVALFCDLVGAFEPCSQGIWLLVTKAWADLPPAALRVRRLGFAALRASILGLVGLAYTGSVLASSSLLSGGVGAALLTLGAAELRKAARLAGESTT